jgi:hypothetical protein
MRRFLQACWVGLVLAGPVAAPALAQSEGLRPDTRLNMVAQMGRAVAQGYYDPQLNGVDWSSALAAARADVLSATDDTAVYDVLRRLANTLNDAHTRFRSPQESLLRRQQLASTVGFTVRLIDGQPVVARQPGRSARRQARADRHPCGQHAVRRRPGEGESDHWARLHSARWSAASRGPCVRRTTRHLGPGGFQGRRKQQPLSRRHLA